jgi:chemotaxis signal transduction protein
MSAMVPSDSTAAVLRRAFDLSFSLLPNEHLEAFEELLIVRVKGDPYAIRLREIAGIVKDRTVVPVPTARGDVLGLVGIRGAFVPVFSLASLLGYAVDDVVVDDVPWMVLCGVDEPIALAFSSFDGYRRVATAAIHTDENVGEGQEHPHEVARLDGGVRPVIRISLIAATIRRDIGPGQPPTE